MKYVIIDAKDAPSEPVMKTSSALEAERIISQLANGKVAKVDPDEGQTLRGPRVGIGRAAKENGVKVQTWDANDVLYVKLLG